MNSQVNSLSTHAASEINLDDDSQVDDALRAAVRVALLDHKLRGDYVVAWRDGHIVHIAADDIVVPEETSWEDQATSVAGGLARSNSSSDC